MARWTILFVLLLITFGSYNCAKTKTKTDSASLGKKIKDKAFKVTDSIKSVISFGQELAGEFSTIVSQGRELYQGISSIANQFGEVENDQSNEIPYLIEYGGSLNMDDVKQSLERLQIDLNEINEVLSEIASATTRVVELNNAKNRLIDGIQRAERRYKSFVRMMTQRDHYMNDTIWSTVTSVARMMTQPDHYMNDTIWSTVTSVARGERLEGQTESKLALTYSVGYSRTFSYSGENFGDMYLLAQG